MSVAAAAWGMSRNMPHEVYMQNYNKILVDSGLGALRVNYNPDDKKKNTKEETKNEDKTVRKSRRVTITEPKEEDEEPKKRRNSRGKKKAKFGGRHPKAEKNYCTLYNQ